MSLPSYTGSALKREINFCKSYLGLLYFWSHVLALGQTRVEYLFTFVVSTFPYVAQPERLNYFQVLFILQRLGNSHGNNLFDGDMHDTKVFKIVTR